MRTEKDIINLINDNLNPVENKELRPKNIAATFAPDSLLNALSFLKANGYEHLSTISCVDWIDDNQFELVYHLFSYDDLLSISVKTRIDREKATFITSKELWPVAEFYERDIHDFFGIKFAGNDNLEELILENWKEIPPMRKDFDTRKYVNEKFEWRDYRGQKNSN